MVGFMVLVDLMVMANFVIYEFCGLVSLFCGGLNLLCSYVSPRGPYSSVTSCDGVVKHVELETTRRTPTSRQGAILTRPVVFVVCEILLAVCPCYDFRDILNTLW